MTTLHQKALETADEAYAKAQASAGIEWLTSEQQHMRGLDAAISAYLSIIEPSKPVAEAVKVKPLEWAPVVEGGRDIQSQTEFGLYAISVDSSFAGGTHYLWTPDQRDYDHDHHSEHRGMTSARAAAQADYEQRVMSALSTPPQPVFADRHNDETGECEMVDAEPEMVAALRRKVAERKTSADEITDLRKRCAELEAALQNMMGCYDTPLSRRRFPPDEFMKEAIETARAALSTTPEVSP